MKLQPNFSWQKYQGEPEDQKQQFQYQLQSQHVQVANSINSDIDDESFWLRERQTSFTWIDGRPIYTKTLPTSAWGPGGTVNTIPLGIVGPFTIVEMFGTLSDGTLATSNTISLPHLDPTYGPGSVSIVRNGTNIILTTSGGNSSAFSGYVTVYYVKG